ncbi:acyltransferase [Blastococcus sp. LR1]|uniref:acyltransferase family protein n=1 Tax=Blastococcus sp. LR1 TaxID=2877000 RepID=UPI001CCEC157|nr:acyltransferase [Blastococcus sp. LR1]MCA0145152.1 acyltransferase [Blastococcus sp. LR1]
MTASAALEGGPVARVERTYPALDGLRAVAALAVLVHHASYWSGDHSDDVLGRTFSRLDVGVAVFFVLSGFLLSRPLFQAAAEGRPAPRTAAYLWRRALRILPAYWLTIAAALLLLPRNEGVGPDTWIRHLTFTQYYGDGWFGDGLSHAWSLATEVAFYLVLPFVGAGLVALSRRSPGRPVRALVALGAATLGSLAWTAWTWTSRPTIGATDLWLPAYAGWFAAGLALALLTVSSPSWGPVRVAHELGRSLPTCWAAAGALFWIASSQIAGPIDLAAPTPGQAVLRKALYLAVGLLLVLPLVFGNQRDGVTRRVLAGPAARFLGEISYALFLVHLVVIAGGYALFDVAPFSGSLFLVLVPTLVVSLVVAVAVYWLVERPLRRWRGLVADPASSTSKRASSAASATSTSV